MRPVWRLATNSVFGRRSRAVLLIAVVALASMLIAAVGVALGSLRGAIDQRVRAVVGAGDLRLRAGSGGRVFDEGVVRIVRGWPEVRVAAPRLTAPLALRFVRPVWEAGESGLAPRVLRAFTASAIGQGIDPALEGRFRVLTLIDGRLPAADDEIALDNELASRLSRALKGPTIRQAVTAFMGLGQDMTPGRADIGPDAASEAVEIKALNDAHALRVGDSVELLRFGQAPLRLRVVGVLAQPPLGGNPMGYLTLAGLQAATGQAGKVSQVDAALLDPSAAQGVADRRAASLPEGVVVQTSEKITSGLDRNMRVNQFGFVVASMMSFFAAGFIIMTGMSTSVTERQRELAILRCVGASRGQVAGAQLLAGVMVGSIGALVGIPLGVGAAAFMVEYFRERLNAPVTVEAWRLGLAFLGAVVAGVVGAGYPAWQASRVSPLAALASRAVPPKARTFRLITLAGLIGVLTHLAIFTLISDGRTVFFSYISLGLPAMMAGYFLLGVPAVALATMLLAGPLSRALNLPRPMLARSVATTPYRFGFTAGAMMAGLALMVAIWTQGGAAVRDWLDKIRFPDAFVVGINLSERSQRELERLPFVTRTSAVAMHPVETEAFGIRDFTRVKSFFIAFEPRSFFEMSRLDFIQGDPDSAARRIEEGGAVIVAREFLVARGLGVGDTFRCWDDGREHAFEIVGVVTSPGLELISEFFDVGEEFTDQRVHAVFGGRKDLRERFNSDSVGLIQVDLTDTVSDDEALQAIRSTLLSAGVLNAGSGRQIKHDIARFVNTSLLVSSLIAVFAMFVACFGVANLIVAGIQSRQFEFGVLRAVGGSRSLLTRLILAEALLIALAACVLGTLMGLQGAFGGIRLNRLLWGLELRLTPPLIPILAGWGFVLAMTLGAAGPAVIALARKRPRDLLQATRG